MAGDVTAARPLVHHSLRRAGYKSCTTWSPCIFHSSISGSCEPEQRRTSPARQRWRVGGMDVAQVGLKAGGQQSSAARAPSESSSDRPRMRRGKRETAAINVGSPAPAAAQCCAAAESQEGRRNGSRHSATPMREQALSCRKGWLAHERRGSWPSTSALQQQSTPVWPTAMRRDTARERPALVR